MGLMLPAARKEGRNPASPAPHGGVPPAQSIWHTPGDHRWSGLVPGLLNKSKNKPMTKGRTPPTGGATLRRAIPWGNNLLPTQSVVLMQYYRQASHAFLQNANPPLPDPLHQSCRDQFRGQREAQARL